MGKTLIFFLALSLLMALAQSKHGQQGFRHGGMKGGWYDNDDDYDWDDDGSGSYDNDDDDDDDWGDGGSGWSFNGKKYSVFPGSHHFRHQFNYWNNNGQTVIHLENCHISNCMKCTYYNCRQCMPGFRLKRQPFLYGKRCVLDCPLGKRDARGKCQKNACLNVPNCLKCQGYPLNQSCMKCKSGWYRYKGRHQTVTRCVSVCPRGYRAINGTQPNSGPACQQIPSFCFNAPNCVKCDKFPWTRSCLRCKNGWYRHKPQYQMIARCLKVCPRGYRPNAGTQKYGPTCEKIPSFCFNAPNCVKCDKFPWTRSCLRCKNGWYRHKPQYQMIARCLKVCPRGYRPNAGTQKYGPTCEKIPSFCYNAPNCVKCDKFPWTSSCLRCRDGWYRHKPKFQLIARCLKTCPRGYRANTGGRNFGPTCEMIPSFCFNTPRCLKCDKFPWTRSCLRCEDGWYRYKAPYQKVARCLKTCPRGYQANVGGPTYGPTCEKIPSFCHRLRHCDECPGFPWSRSCRRCESGWYRYKPSYHKTTRCIRTCPRGYRATNGTRKVGPTCKKIKSFCLRLRKCKECTDKFPLHRSCKRCEDGWYRYIPPFQINAKCVRKCRRGYQATNGTSDTGPTCEEIQPFCRDVSHCQDCQGPFWPPSCNRCEEGWYRYENPPSQISATCVQDCPGGFQATNSTDLLGPTCEKRQSKCNPGCKRCHNIFTCDECDIGMAKLISQLGFGERCVLECPRGYTKQLVNNTFYECQKECRDKNCENCESVSYHGPYHCDYCKPGFHKLHRNQRDECVLKCPSGYTAEMDVIEGSICRKDQSVEPTVDSIPTATTEDGVEFTSNPTTITADDVPTTTRKTTQPTP